MKNLKKELTCPSGAKVLSPESLLQLKGGSGATPPPPPPPPADVIGQEDVMIA